MSLKAQYPDPSSGWQPHRALITQLYRDEDRSLKDVMQFMQTQHGFKATEKMYKSRFKAWGLDKNHKCHEVRKILQQRAARKALGKKSAFVLRGRPVDIADVERYAKRKGLTLTSTEAHSTQVIQDLICFTPPPTPPSIDAPTSLRNTEHFLFFYNAFLEDALQSGFWRLGRDVLGFSSVHGARYPISARNEFFLSIERGISRFQWEEISQAYRQWRQAFSQLQFLVRSRNPSQLICLVELLASLALCEREVTVRLLRYLGNLAHRERVDSDSRLAMLQSLSQLEVEDLCEISKVSRGCSWKAFRNHFSVESFFLPDSEIVLVDSRRITERDVDLTDSGADTLNSGSGTYDQGALRASRGVMEILMASHEYTQAESFAFTSIQRMQHVTYDGVVGAVLTSLYNNLVHIYLLREDYEKAYKRTVDRVENYFEMLIYRADLPEDLLLSTYSQLGFLARRLGKQEDADRWSREHTILKTRIDKLAEKEILALQTVNDGSLEELSIVVVDLGEPQSPSSPESLREMTIEETLASGPRLCGGHVFDEEEITGKPQSLKQPFRPSISYGSGGGGGGGHGGRRMPCPRPIRAALPPGGGKPCRGWH